MCMHAGVDAPKRKAIGKRMSFEEAVEHVGGLEQMISAEGRSAIHENAVDYMWKYGKTDNGNAYCTACGTCFEPERYVIRGRQNQQMECPACGKWVTFKYAEKGHKSVYDQFVFYEWRRSVLEPETVTLTAAHIWRDSGDEMPEDAPLNIAVSALYVFKSGMRPAVFKRSVWKTKSHRRRNSAGWRAAIRSTRNSECAGTAASLCRSGFTMCCFGRGWATCCGRSYREPERRTRWS